MENNINKMFVIIPACGLGTRFYPYQKITYPIFKIPLLSWVLNEFRNLKNNNLKIIVTHREDIDLSDIISSSKILFGPNITFFPLSKTCGAAETVFKTVLNFKNEMIGHSILSIDSDNIWDLSGLKFEGNNCYYAKVSNNSFAYSTLQIKNDKLIKIEEKTGNTDNICVGAYQFANLETFIDSYEKTFKNELSFGEKFLSNMLNNVTDVNCIQVNNFWCLGTPKQIEIFTHFYLHEESRKILISKNILTFENIKFLKEKGHKVYSKCDNISESENISNLGIDCFYKFGDKIDFHIEDICKTNYDCRYFHKIVIKNGKFKKYGSNLYSQSSFYHNIDEKFKKYFPKIYNPISKNKIVLEEIRGLSFAHLYLKELLTQSDLINLCIILNNFHQYRCFEKININNYGKIISRLSHENYNHIEYNETLENFENFYTNYEQGQSCFVHGDPILSNILMDNVGSIFLIDPRGSYFSESKTEVTSIFGDPNYDWAKLYQSLTGYEEIISGKYVTKNYKNSMLSCYEKYLLEIGVDINMIKNIASSLYFSLIPFHNVSKSLHFYKKCLEL